MNGKESLQTSVLLCVFPPVNYLLFFRTNGQLPDFVYKFIFHHQLRNHKYTV